MKPERWRERGTGRYVAAYFESYSSGRTCVRFINSDVEVKELPLEAFELLFERVMDDGTTLKVKVEG